MRKHVIVVAALTLVVVGAVVALIAKNVAQAKREYAIWEAVSSPTPIAVINFDPNKPVTDHNDRRNYGRTSVGGLFNRGRNKEYPLQIAARDGAPGTVQRLIDSGADIEAPGIYGTPLMYAVGSDWRRIYIECKIENVRVLLAAGANVCVRDAYWGSLLNVVSIAELYHHYHENEVGPILRLLISEAWDDCLLVPDSAGRSPLMIWTSLSITCGLIEALLSKGDGARAIDNNGMTTLMYTAMTSQDTICTLRTLLAHGADPNAKNNGGLTVLDFARQAGAPQEAIELLEAAMRDAASAQ